MNNKAIGTLNLILGTVGMIFQASMLFVVYPKLNSLYVEFGASLPISTKIFPYITVLSLFMFVGMIIIGARLILSKDSNTKLSKIGLFFVIVTVLLGGWQVSTSLSSLLTPLYGLTSY